MKDHLLLAKCSESGHSILEQIRLATAYLQAQGVEEAKENAELLLLYVLELNRTQLLLKWHDSFPIESIDRWLTLLSRKGEGEPIQYITGEAWFYGERFEVTNKVLIPRPETELLVEAVLKENAPLSSSSLVALDVGTGSGAISITLQLQRPEWKVIASDLSQDALEQAQHNAALHEVKEQIEWVQGDLLAPFIDSTSGQLIYNNQPIDILVSNPPYIPKRDMADLQREVKDFEPHLALVGGEDGLDPYRAMINVLSELNIRPRIVAFELGIHQPAIVKEMLEKIGAWDEVNIITDYNGIDRHVIAIKKRSIKK